MINLAIKRIWICFFMILPIKAFLQDVVVLVREAEKLELSFHEYDALQKYKEVLRGHPSNLNALCRCSELCSRIGHRQSDKNREADYYRAAKIYAESAIHVDPASPEANFVMAMAMGRMALISSGREKVQYVNQIRKYAENVLKYDPNNFKAYHVLGKWNYEVSNLNFVERGLAKLLYGGLPDASIKAAIRYYEKSRSLEPKFALNYLELAKAYHRIGENNKAVDLLKKLQSIPNKIEDDVMVKKEGLDLYEKWKDMP